MKTNQVNLVLLGSLVGLLGVALPGIGQISSSPATPTTEQATTGTLSIKGRVVDEHNEGVPGVTLVLQGTTRATSTDADGQFELIIPASVRQTLPNGQVKLVLSSVGFTSRLIDLSPQQEPDDDENQTITVRISPTEIRIQETQMRVAQQQQQQQQEEPTFPWPPPKPSTRQVLPDAFMKNVRYLGGADARLRAALDQAQYSSPSYYRIPNGFAVVTQLEQIEDDARPKPESERWQATMAPAENWLDWFRNLVITRKGYFRVLVFVVTSSPFASAKDTIKREDAEGWFTSGLNALPPGLSKIPYDSSYHCTALVYEFEKVAGQPSHLRQPSAVTCLKQLAVTGIWPSR